MPQVTCYQGISISTDEYLCKGQVTRVTVAFSRQWGRTHKLARQFKVRNDHLGAVALTMGGHIRVGLEDNLLLEKGKLAQSNRQSVAKMRYICEELGSTTATPEEARQMIGLKGLAKVGF